MVICHQSPSLSSHSIKEPSLLCCFPPVLPLVPWARTTDSSGCVLHFWFVHCETANRTVPLSGVRRSSTTASRAREVQWDVLASEAGRMHHTLLLHRLSKSYYGPPMPDTVLARTVRTELAESTSWGIWC